MVSWLGVGVGAVELNVEHVVVKNEIKEINSNDLDNLNKVLTEISQVNQEKREYLEENI